MKNKKLISFFEENDFSVNIFMEEKIECAEIETWTSGGVNMIHLLRPFNIKQFKEIVNDFNVDEEIELHRQGSDYKNAFTIRESLEDFEEYRNRLKEVSFKFKPLPL